MIRLALSPAGKLSALPADDGWVVVQMRNPPRNGDDLHIMRVWRPSWKPNERQWFRHRTDRRVLRLVLCDPFRYRSQARKFKGTIVRQMKLGRSHWLQGCDDV